MNEIISKISYDRLHHDVRMGFVSDDIVEFTRDKGIDLIVMGTTGASGMKEVFFGSVAAAVIEKAEVMVLAIPSAYVSHKVPDTMIYAADFTDNETQILQTLSNVCMDWECALRIFHVKSDEPLYTSRPPRELFSEFVASTSFTQINYEEAEKGDVVDAIQEYTETMGCDVLAMALHKRNILERLFHKSKTREMAHHTKIPMLALHKKRLHN